MYINHLMPIECVKTHRVDRQVCRRGKRNPISERWAQSRPTSQGGDQCSWKTPLSHSFYCRTFAPTLQTYFWTCQDWGMEFGRVSLRGIYYI